MKWSGCYLTYSYRSDRYCHIMKNAFIVLRVMINHHTTLISLYLYETLWPIVSATHWKCSTTVQIGHCHLVFVILLIPKTNCCLIILCVCLTLTESPFQSKNGALFWVATFVHAAAHRYAMNGHVRFVNKTQVHIITEDKLLDHRWKNILLRWNYWTMQYSVPMYFPISIANSLN